MKITTLIVVLFFMSLYSSSMAEELHPPMPLEKTATEPVETGTVGKQPREFQGDEIGQVLRLLARQSKIDLVVSENVSGTVTMRLLDKTAFDAIEVIVRDKKLVMREVKGTYFIEPGPDYVPPPEMSLFGGSVAEMGFLSFGYGLLGIIIGYGAVAIFVMGFIHLVGALCTAFTEAGKAVSPFFFRRLGLLLLLGPFAATIALRNSAQAIHKL